MCCERQKRDPAKARQRSKRYRQRNAEKHNDRTLAYYYANKEQRRAYEQRNSITIAARRARRAKQRLLTDPNYVLSVSLRDRLRKALKGIRTGSAIRSLGCSIEDLKLFIESRWQPGMSWANYGHVWHLDHIRALALFDLTDSEQFAQAVHYTNIQPLDTATHRVKTNEDIRLIRWFKSVTPPGDD
jgi:hypothetical protein